MSESEKQAIVDADVPTIVDERHETSEPAIQQTAGPSTRPACSGEQAGLGRDDSNGEDSIIGSAPPLSSSIGDRADSQDGPGAPETGNLKLETATGAALETRSLKLETVTGLCH